MLVRCRTVLSVPVLGCYQLLPRSTGHRSVLSDSSLVCRHLWCAVYKTWTCFLPTSHTVQSGWVQIFRSGTFTPWGWRQCVRNICSNQSDCLLSATTRQAKALSGIFACLTFRHRALYKGQALRYFPENAFYIFNQHIYFIIWYLLDRASLI